jgi:hypothetical protein
MDVGAVCVVFNRRVFFVSGCFEVLVFFVLDCFEVSLGYSRETKDKYLNAIKSAGFKDVAVVDESFLHLDCMANDPIGQAILGSLKGSPEQLRDVQSSISSIKVSAIKVS